MRVRRYSDLRHYPTFEDRYDYLALRGTIGERTFGFDRWLNQQFYTSVQWKNVRHQVILRDNGCDLGVPGFEIGLQILIHHMNPITPDDIKNGEEWILDSEFLITTTRRTHNAIHYGDRSLLPQPVVARTRGDTRLW